MNKPKLHTTGQMIDALASNKSATATHWKVPYNHYRIWDGSIEVRSGSEAFTPVSMSLEATDWWFVFIDEKVIYE